MVDTRTKFRHLARVFDPIYQPRQDGAGGPGADYVPETHEGYRLQLEAALDLNDHAKLLVAGQPGCGKTTLLLNIAHSLRAAGRVVAFVDLEANTAVQDLDPVEMHLASLAELLEEAGRAGAEITASTLGLCGDWLAALDSDGAGGPSDVAAS